MMYLVHKHTKEHRRYEDAIDWRDSDCQLILADADGWIEWHGGECPLPDGHLCDIRVRDGSENFGVPANKHIGKKWPDAGPAFWECEGVSGDIIAYRPILENETPKAKEPEAPAWNGEGLPPAGIRCEALRSHGWVEVYVVGYCEDGYCVFDTGSDFKGNKDPSKFRPIRSEEDQFVDEMVRDLAKAGCEGFTLKHYARILYRAGYRKEGK